MSGDRERILGRIRERLGRGADDAEARAAIEARLAAHAPVLIPARARGDDPVGLFVAMAEAVDTTIARVEAMAAVPEAVADYLAAHNLPTRGARAPALDALPWDRAPLLDLRPGPASADDALSVTGAFAAIAETGTLMLVSGPDHPTTLNFLADVHVAVLAKGRIVGAYEDGFALLRRERADLPRTVNFVTGPSRTADIAQTLQLGAHGPRRLHVVLVDGA